MNAIPGLEPRSGQGWNVGRRSKRGMLCKKKPKPRRSQSRNNEEEGEGKREKKEKKKKKKKREERKNGLEFF